MASRKLKKDFDKEKMYSKIMPSVAVPNPPEAEEPEETADNTGSQEPASLKLRNFMEDIVSERLVRTIDMLHGCKCERCQKDIMALALNELPPAYLVVETGRMREMLLSMRVAHEVKVTAALIKAIQAIKGSPNH